MAAFYASSAVQPASLVYTRDYKWTHPEAVSVQQSRSYGMGMTSGGPSDPSDPPAPPPRPTVGLLYPR